MKSIDGIIRPTEHDIRELMPLADDKHDRQLRKESARDQKIIDDALHDRHLIQIIDLAYNHLSGRGRAYLANRLIEVKRNRSKKHERSRTTNSRG